MASEPPRYVRVEPGRVYTLPEIGGRPACPHIFEHSDIDALNAALATSRPLLLRGVPGVGKSQLARAAAAALGRGFVATVVDARTEARDLRFTYDAVRRLAKAQLQAVRPLEDETAMAERYFIEPGPLWWAFDWLGAMKQKYRFQHGHEPRDPHALDGVRRPWHPETGFEAVRDGVVVLIDEIDKAEAVVPNGLLEALGDGRFEALGAEGTVRQVGVAPLVMITTNEERTLPKAFLRRCWVHHMEPEEEFDEWLTRRGRAHFPDPSVLSDSILARAAEQLAADRRSLTAKRLAAPGQAEFIDLLEALVKLGRDEVARTGAVTLEAAQGVLLERLGRFVFDKNARQTRSQ